jgi:hypothetical protein
VRRRIGAIPGDARNPNKASASQDRVDRVKTPAENVATVWILAGNGADDLDAGNHQQLADLLNREFSLPARRPFGGEAGRDNDRLGIDLGRDPQARDQSGEEDTLAPIFE